MIRGNEEIVAGAVYNTASRLDCVHCTITGNKGELLARAIQSPGTLNLINSIVWGNTGTTLSEITRAPLGRINTINSIVAGGEEGGINTDPQLIPAGWLKSTSPAINRGGIAAVAASRVDIHGDVRPTGATPDLGADEYKDANGISDADGLPDWAEGADDNDGLSASDEYLIYGTNPHLADTDGDGLNDGQEIQVGANLT